MRGHIKKMIHYGTISYESSSRFIFHTQFFPLKVHFQRKTGTEVIPPENFLSRFKNNYQNVLKKRHFENKIQNLIYYFSVSVPASISPQPSDGKFVVRKGSTITLECEARGNPKPKITWQRAVSFDFGIHFEDILADSIWSASICFSDHFTTELLVCCKHFCCGGKLIGDLNLKYMHEFLCIASSSSSRLVICGKLRRMGESDS